MPTKLVVPLLVVGVATGVAAHFAFATGVGAASEIQAGGGGLGWIDTDTDDDFLPDAIEWAVLTNSQNPDTDGDQIPDFVEVVQRGKPRHPNAPLADDQEMRLVITGPSAGSQVQVTWMHILLRVAEPTTPLQQLATWLEMPHLPGVRFSLDAFAAGGIVVRDRYVNGQGLWLRLSVPLVSTNVLQCVLPCTIYAESTIGGRSLRNGVSLFAWANDIVSMVPFGDDQFVMQPLTPSAASPLPLSNRVCVMDLVEVGSGPGGTIYEVAAANCEACPELECGSDCSSCVGYILTIPGGVGMIAGG